MRADVVVMTNGDKFTGTVVTLEDGKLTWKPADADPIALAGDQVARLTVTQPLVLPTSQKSLSITLDRKSTTASL